MRNNSMQESADTLLKNGEWRQAFPCAKRAMESSLEEMDNRKRGPRNQFWLKSFLAPLK